MLHITPLHNASSSPDESPNPIREECLVREVPEEPGEVCDQKDRGEPAREPLPCDEVGCAEGESRHRGEDVEGVGDPAVEPEPHVREVPPEEPDESEDACLELPLPLSGWRTRFLAAARPPVHDERNPEEDHPDHHHIRYPKVPNSDIHYVGLTGGDCHVRYQVGDWRVVCEPVEWCDG